MITGTESRLVSRNWKQIDGLTHFKSGLSKKEHLFVDQEVGGSIPPNRTNTFNDLADYEIQLIYFR